MRVPILLARSSLSLATVTLVIGSLRTLSGATAPPLGTAGSFAVLGGSTVTNTGPTAINGNLGVSPGGAVTGFPPGAVAPPGTIHSADAVAAGAQGANTAAYNALAGQACNFNLTGQNLGGLTLVAGVYCFATSAQLTGTLTLDAQGNANAVFIFQIGSALTTASSSSVTIINGGTPCNVFWQVGSSATLGTTTSFLGNILALSSITLNTNAVLSGRALAQNGAVTLDTNNVSITQCNATFVAPPDIVKNFGAAAIGLTGDTTLSFTINNPNPAIALTGVGFTDTLPAGLMVSTPSNGLSGSCGAGTITALAGSGSVSLTGGSVPGGASCTFSVSVTGTSLGTQTNSVAVGSNNGGPGNTSTTSINVLGTAPVIAPPTIVKAFGAAGIGVGGTVALIFKITNPNSVVNLNGIGFNDTLSGGLVVATPNGLTGPCGGVLPVATAGSGAISLTGAALGPGSSCTFAVNVTATSVGAVNNSVFVSSTNGGTGNTSIALLNVVPAVVAPPSISKSFGLGPMTPGVSATLSFTISNPNATVALSGVGFTDLLPTGLLVATPNGLSGPCGGVLPVATAGTGTISLTGATLGAGSSCTFSVNVIAAGQGLLTNLTGNVFSTNGGFGNTAAAQILFGPDLQVSYAANLDQGESFINIINTGVYGAPQFGPGFGGAGTGNICVNVYAFSADEQLISCCSCLVTPDQVVNLGVVHDLTAKALTGSLPTSVTVEMVSSAPGADNCAGSAATVTNPLGGGSFAAWQTTLHAGPGGVYTTVEHPFLPATLNLGNSGSNLQSLTTRCAAIVGNGSSYGVCNSCQAGALGATKK